MEDVLNLTGDRNLADTAASSNNIDTERDRNFLCSSMANVF